MQVKYFSFQIHSVLIECCLNKTFYVVCTDIAFSKYLTMRLTHSTITVAVKKAD